MFKEMFTESQSAGQFYRGETYKLDDGTNVIVISDFDDDADVTYMNLRGFKKTVSPQLFNNIIDKEINKKKDVNALIKATKKAFNKGKITESQIDDMIESLYDVSDSDKGAQAIWDWFMDNMSDSSLYAGDAMPEDYIDEMTDKQVRACYKAMKKYIK